MGSAVPYWGQIKVLGQHPFLSQGVLWEKWGGERESYRGREHVHPTLSSWKKRNPLVPGCGADARTRSQADGVRSQGSKGASHSHHHFLQGSADGLLLTDLLKCPFREDVLSVLEGVLIRLGVSFYFKVVL